MLIEYIVVQDRESGKWVFHSEVLWSTREEGYGRKKKKVGYQYYSEKYDSPMRKNCFIKDVKIIKALSKEDITEKIKELNSCE